MKHTDKEYQEKEMQSLHEQYQAESNELPAADLDARILQAAHQAVEKTDGLASNVETSHLSGIDTQSVKRAWYVPVSYVAILVISLSVVMKLALEPEMSSTLTETDGSFYVDEIKLQQSHKEDLALTEEAPSSSVQRAKPMTIKPMVSSVEMPQQTLPDSDQVFENKLSSIHPQKPAAEKKLKSSAAVEMHDTQPLEQKIEAPAGTMAKARTKKAQEKQKRISSQSMGMLAEPVEADMEMSEGFNIEIAESDKVQENQLPVTEVEEKLIAARKQAVFSKESISKQMENTNIPESQRLKIDQLMVLYKNKQYKELSKAIQEYRKDYPQVKEGDALPQVLLDWESENISKTSQKQ